MFLLINRTENPEHVLHNNDHNGWLLVSALLLYIWQL